MFSDTTSASIPPPPNYLSYPRPIYPRPLFSGTECSVHCAVSGGEWGFLSTSVPLHLQTTIVHREAPQYYPEGIAGEIWPLRKKIKWGFLQKHSHWDEHSGPRGSGHVGSTQIKATSPTLARTMPSTRSRTLIKAVAVTGD